jgi:hypothetical protein
MRTLFVPLIVLIAAPGIIVIVAEIRYFPLRKIPR